LILFPSKWNTFSCEEGEGLDNIGIIPNKLVVEIAEAQKYVDVLSVTVWFPVLDGMDLFSVPFYSFGTND
jgi:hypothetical protein